MAIASAILKATELPVKRLMPWAKRSAFVSEGSRRPVVGRSSGPRCAKPGLSSRPIFFAGAPSTTRDRTFY
jgi:hypothetical protein